MAKGRHCLGLIATIKFVVKDKALAVLDLMMAVHLKLLSVQSMATANVLPTNLVILNVDLALMMYQKIVKLQKMM